MSELLSYRRIAGYQKYSGPPLKEGKPVPDVGAVLPPGLQEGGLWLAVIRQEIQTAIKTEAYAQVLRVPPRPLRWLLKPWLRFQAPTQAERQG